MENNPFAIITNTVSTPTDWEAKFNALQKRYTTLNTKSRELEGIIDELSQNKPSFKDLFNIDDMIVYIKNYSGQNIDFLSLKKNFNKTGHNGVFYRRAVMNTLYFVKEGLR